MGISLSRSATIAVLVGGFLCATWRTHAADDPAPAIGLRGILPNAVPDDLTDSIAALPDTWRPWGDALSVVLTDLYTKADLDVAGQRQTIAAVKGNLNTIKKALGDPKYRGIGTLLAGLYGQLQRRVDVAEAVLDTLELTPAAKTAQVEAARSNLAQTAQPLNGYLKELRNGSTWEKYLQVGEATRLASDGNAEEAVPVLAAVQTKFKGRTGLQDDKSREFLGRPQFAAYERAVDDYLVAVNHLAADANGPEVRQSLTSLLAAIEQYEATQTKTSSAEARKAFDAVRRTAVDGGARMTQALSTDYLNYNLRVTASQTFLSKILKRHRIDNGAVNDYILGAKVDGSQTTVSDVSVRLLPSAKFARLNLIINGQVSSNTQGVTDQATVFTQGNHYFTAQKELDFDGDQFWTGPASVSVQANNNTFAAQTNFSWVPLFGRLTEGIAMNAAADRRGESEAIAASRITDRVVPQLNDEMNRDFGPTGKSTSGLKKRLATFRELGVYPQTKVYKTSDRELFFNARLMADDELGGAAPEPITGPGLSVQIHESMINNSIDRLGIAGKTMTQDELSELIRQRLSKLLDKDVKFKTVEKDAGADKGPNTLVMDATDPIRFGVANGQLSLTVRAGFKQEGKEDIPAQIVTLPIKFSIQGNKIISERGEVRVAPVEKPENVGKQIARAGIIKGKFENALPRREYERTVNITRDDKSTATAVITRIDAVDGWLILLME